LSVCVFVNDGGGACPVTEDGWGDPWLKDEPTAEVYTTNFVVIVVEGNGPLCVTEAAVFGLA